MEFGRRNPEKNMRGVPDKEAGVKLIGRYRLQGLDKLLTEAQENLGLRGGAAVDDSDALDGIVRRIQMKVNEISGSQVGLTITNEDVEKYIRERFNSDT